MQPLLVALDLGYSFIDSIHILLEHSPLSVSLLGLPHHIQGSAKTYLLLRQ
jgi:hypothetical protein